MNVIVDTEVLPSKCSMDEEMLKKGQIPSDQKSPNCRSSAKVEVIGKGYQATIGASTFLNGRSSTTEITSQDDDLF